MSTAEALDESAPETLEDASAKEQLAGDASTNDSTGPQSSTRCFYGWLMLPLAMLLMIATSPGQTFGFSFFNAKFREAFVLTQTQLSGTYLFATVLASLALPYIGGLTDRYGLRRSALAAVAAMAGVCVFISQTSGVVTLFLSFLMFRVMGPGTLVLLANNTLARWFDRRLGMVSAMMQIAMAGAMALVPVAMVMLIDYFGWRGAYLAIAGLLACGLLPLVGAVYRESPFEIGQFPDGDCAQRHEESGNANLLGLTVQQARSERAFWILLLATAAWALIGTGYIFHLEAIFEAQGMGKSASTRAMTCLAISMGAAQLIGGLLADRFQLRWLLVAAVGLIAASGVMLAVGTAEILIASFVVYGVGQGLMSIVAATGWARFFGRAHLGKIRGMSLTAAIAGSSLGPLMLAVSDDYLGGFAPALWCFAGMAGMIAVAGFWATPPRGEDVLENGA